MEATQNHVEGSPLHLLHDRNQNKIIWCLQVLIQLWQDNQSRMHDSSNRVDDLEDDQWDVKVIMLALLEVLVQASCFSELQTLEEEIHRRTNDTQNVTRDDCGVDVFIRLVNEVISESVDLQQERNSSQKEVDQSKPDHELLGLSETVVHDLLKNNV